MALPVWAPWTTDDYLDMIKEGNRARYLDMHKAVALVAVPLATEMSLADTTTK
jgi:hypothetical protein